MNQYFAASYTGTPFQLFGFDHLIANLLILLVIIAMGWILRHDTGRHREQIRLALAGFLVANQIAWDAWQYFNGLWSVAYLPWAIRDWRAMLAQAPRVG